ncbi:AAA family ATPase [Nostoc sp. TCL240-02]|uniref:ATP-binding protein n=1 Tax=Nostoc sp. TCL240-02 TaxID=2572090 RepID=UPI0020C6884C|nr:AAA family ATPase [Nostoc sp. TCL240-02]
MEFSPGINIIVGRNNAGKTSLLEVLTLNFENHPHRSLKTLPNKFSSLQEESKIQITLHIEKEELRNLIKNLSIIGIPRAATEKCYFLADKYEYDPDRYHDQYMSAIDESVKYAVRQFKDFLENSDFIQTSLFLQPNIKMDNNSLIKLLNFESYKQAFQKVFYKIEYDDSDQIVIEKTTSYSDENGIVQEHFVNYSGKIQESIGYKLFDKFQNRIYRFQAERLNIGICKCESKADINLKSNVLILRKYSLYCRVKFQECLINSIN